MLTDLVQIKRFGEKQREENQRFRAWMKRHNFVRRAFQGNRRKRWRRKSIAPPAPTAAASPQQPVSDRDAERLARYFGMSEAEFLRDYTVESEDEGRILKRNENGCVFLEGNLCSVYDSRPQTCELFPHLVKGNGSLLSRMWHMPDRAVYCPIVFNTLEQFKAETGFKK